MLKRWMFILLAMGLVIGAVLLFGRLVVFYKPWRSSEVMALSVATIVSGLVLSWISVHRPRLRTAWVALIVAGWLFVGAAYGVSYRVNHKANVRAILEYVDSERIPNRADKSAPSVAEVGRHFRARPPVQLERLPRIHSWTEPARLESRADELMASTYSLPAYPAAALPEDLAWDEDPFRDPTWSFELHSMDS